MKRRSTIDQARRLVARSATQRRAARFVVERRDAGDGDGAALHVAGHAAVWNTLSLPLYDWWEGRYVEQIAVGAFTKTLQEADVRMLINHNPDLVCARTASGTLRLAEDNVGLAIDADMADTSYCRDLAALLARGDVDQMSFMFEVVRDEWDETAEGTPRRTLLECKLYDVSPVTFPAYEETEIGLRAGAVGTLCRRLGLLDLPADQRELGLAGLLGQDLTPDHLPALRAAQGALAALVESVEPATAPLDRSDAPAGAPAIPVALLRRRLALKGRELGLA